MEVIATDTEGHRFKKQISIQKPVGKYGKGRVVICFGWPVEYYAEDLLKHYPFQDDMCIDISGRNHKGCQVSISAKQMDEVVENCILNIGVVEPIQENLDF